MVRAEYSPEAVNAIANSPAVRPFVDYREDQSEPLDFTPAVGWATQTGIVWLTDGDGALSAFVQTGDREYQAHIMFDAGCRGRKALDTAGEMLAYMKRYSDRIWVAIPLSNRALKWFAHKVGFKPEGFDKYEAEGPVEIAALEFC